MRIIWPAVRGAEKGDSHVTATMCRSPKATLPRPKAGVLRHMAAIDFFLPRR